MEKQKPESKTRERAKKAVAQPADKVESKSSAKAPAKVKKTARKRSTKPSAAKVAEKKAEAAAKSAQAALEEAAKLRQALAESQKLAEEARQQARAAKVEAMAQQELFAKQAATNAEWMRSELASLRAETNRVREQVRQDGNRPEAQNSWDVEEDSADRRRGDRPPLFGGFARKLISRSGEALGLGDEGIKQLMDEPFQKEAVAGLVESALRSKDEVVRLKDDFARSALKGREDLGKLRGDLQKTMGREVRRQVERLDLREEITKMLADYTLEITARMSFVPPEEDKEDESGEEGSPGGKSKKRGKRKEDLKVRLVRKSDDDSPERPTSSQSGRLHPDRYFDDDDDDDYDD